MTNTNSSLAATVGSDALGGTSSGCRKCVGETPAVDEAPSTFISPDATSALLFFAHFQSFTGYLFWCLRKEPKHLRTEHDQ